MELERAASQTMLHGVDAVTSSPSSFDVPSSSPTIVSGRIVEDPRNLNSCKRAIKLSYHITKKKINKKKKKAELQFLSLKLLASCLNLFTTSAGLEMQFLVSQRVL